MISLILIDLDDCLWDATELSSYARTEALNAMIENGLDIDFHEGLKMLREVVQEYGSNHSGHFNIFLKRLKSLGFDFSGVHEDMLVAAAVIAYHRIKTQMIKPFQDVIPFLTQVQNRFPDVKLAIITDGIPVKQFEKVFRLGLNGFFNEIIISDEIGIRKPNPRLFEYALSKMGVKPESAILVGDRLDNDIIPAKKVNIHTVLIHRKTKYDVPGRSLATKIYPDFEIGNLIELFPIIETLNIEDLSTTHD